MSGGSAAAKGSGPPLQGEKSLRGPPPSMASAGPHSHLQPPALGPAGSFLSASAERAVARAQARAEAQLLSAVASERAMRWPEVVEHYTGLLKTVSKEELPKNFEAGPYYSQLLFETYYHLAVAFQKQNHHKEAVEELTKAIEVASIPKCACQVGCASKTFLHTPLFARRAYAHVKCGNLKEAIDDANKAVELDPLNPDVYCVRALVWSTVKEKKRALFDLNCSLKLKSSHICTLILKGTIKNSLMATEGPQALVKNKEHEKACKLDKDSNNFFDVEDFHSPKMADFYDRFILKMPDYSVEVVMGEAEDLAVGLGTVGLLAPGTVQAKACDCGIPVVPQCSSYNNGSQLAGWKFVHFKVTIRLKSLLPKPVFHKEKRLDLFPRQGAESFVCGTPSTYPDNTAFARRASYGKALKDSGSKSNDSEVSERILRITRAASEWSEKMTSSRPVKKGSESAVASTSGTPACKKKPEQKKCEASKTKDKK